MGIFDFMGGLNPFKKKDEFGFGPLDSKEPGLRSADPFAPNSIGHDPLGGHDPLASPDPLNVQGHGFSGANEDFGHRQIPGHAPSTRMPDITNPEPQDDPRMRLPLGSTIDQARFTGSEHAPQHHPIEKDLELISSKLDYLKASLDAVNQRLMNLEHMARGDDQRSW